MKNETVMLLNELEYSAEEAIRDIEIDSEPEQIKKERKQTKHLLEWLKKVYEGQNTNNEDTETLLE